MLEEILKLLQFGIIFAVIGIVLLIVNHFATKSDKIWVEYKWVLYIFRIFIAFIFIASAIFTGYSIYQMI